MADKRGPREPRTLAPGDEIVDEVTGERYGVRSLIGEGGMGRVFQAEARSSGAIVAVKCNQPIDPTNEALVERTRREGEFLKQLQRHPHIVPVLATGMREDGVFWMVMPFLDGASVGGLLTVLKRIPLAWTLRIAQATCSALAEAHRYAIHRDIKPENVFVTRGGGIYVLDFGAGKFYSVGRLTTAGTTIGTVQYSSPEQLTDPDHLDGRSDLFSVGAMTFEMLTGVHPFDVEGPLRGHRIVIGNRIIREPPHPFAELAPELPSYMAAVVGKLLEKDREKRSRNAAEAERVFGAALNELASKIGPLPPIENIFEVYDEAVRAHELATRDTEKVAPEAKRSGPRAKYGTIPLGAYARPVAPAPPDAVAPPVDVAAAPPVAVAPPVNVAPAPAEKGGGTAPLPTAALADVEPRVDPRSSAPDIADPPQPVASAAPQAPPTPAVQAASTPVPVGAVDEEQVYIQRKLLALERLLVDDSAETREALLTVLRDTDEPAVIRAGAAVALKVVGDAACLDALQDCAASDSSPIVRRMCEEAVFTLAPRLGVAVEPLPFLPENARPSPTSAPPPAAPLVAPSEPPNAAPLVAPSEPPKGMLARQAPLGQRPPAGGMPVSPWAVALPPIAARHGTPSAGSEGTSLALIAVVAFLVAFCVVFFVAYALIL